MAETITQEEAQEFAHIAEYYHPLERIGEGTFSVVYKAIDLISSRSEPKYVAIKSITRTSAPDRVAEEIKFLKDLGGRSNVIELLNVQRHEDSIVAVFPYFEYTEFRELLGNMTLTDIKYYMRGLLIAMSHIHKASVIHRDIKPSNFLYNKERRRGVLIDFGLAQYERENTIEVEQEKKRSVLFFSNTIQKVTNPPGYYVADSRAQMKAPRAGTRGFRAPEVLFRGSNQTTKIDDWSAGVILLILLTKQYPFFHSMDDTDAIVELSTIFGKYEMKQAAHAYGRSYKTNISTIPNERLQFKTIVKKLNPELETNDEVFDLLELLLDLYAEKRISADRALFHPFFSDM